MEAQVFFDPVVYQKIMHWVNKSTVEISGLGKIQMTEDGDIVVTSAILVEQENAAASTDMKPEAVAKAMFHMKDEPGELRFWWHSHVNMPVFWSGTDTDTMKKLGDHGWFVSTVFNKRNETRTAIYQKKPYRIFKDEIKTALWAPTPAALTDEWDKEFLEKCKTKTYESYKSSATTASQYDGYGGYLGDEEEEAQTRLPAITAGEKSELWSDELEKLYKLEVDFHPDRMNQFYVWCVGGEQMTVAAYKKRFDINLHDKAIREYVDYETGISHKAN